MIAAASVRLRRVTPWPYNDPPADFSLPDFGLSPDQHETLADDIWAAVVRGEGDADEFAESYLEEEEGFPLSREQVSGAFTLALEARVVQQAQWTDEQTETNLDRAFGELEEAGILARQDFACCMNCGASEIFDERDDSRRWRGYVFYHEQDTDRLLEGGPLLLAYGGFSVDVDLRELVDKEIMPVLSRHGLAPEWGGSVETRIALGNAQWYYPFELED
jgi:hypothetical protein